MKKIGVIVSASIKNNIRSKSVVAVYLAVSIMIAVVLVILLSVLLIKPAVNSASPDRQMLEIYLSLVIYVSCVICLGINLNVFAFQFIIKEKSKGNLQALLATNLNIKEIWIAKSVAVFMPGLIVGVLTGLIILIAVNLIYFVPKIGFIFTPWAAVSCFVGAPLMYLCLTFLVHLVGLSSNTITANIIVQIFLPVIISLMINIAVRKIVNAASWHFALINLGIALVLALITVFLKNRLKTERVILSR